MLMHFDPFRGELERLAEQLMSGTLPPRPFPMDAYRRGEIGLLGPLAIPRQARIDQRGRPPVPPPAAPCRS